MAPRGKYSEELVDRCAIVIRETGRNQDAIAVMGISHETFYQWLGDPDKPEFRTAVDSAKADFVARGWPKLRQLAQTAIAIHLESVGQMEVTRTRRTTTDPDGRSTEVEEIKTSPVKLIPAVAALALEGARDSRSVYLRSQNLGQPPEISGDGEQQSSVAERIKAGLGLK
jgi:hypothetical protein